ncbi:site-specific integrase [Methylobacterium sp. E-046]|uniref:site-specific integrase n=1 Tax=Methylobacterium sp. E-046 TaxID=2836576 RepID=UPI0028C4D6E1|nr:site-specific integrase [Methylobacterium sp. E-046]
MAKKDARLQLRGSTWWVRVKVPETLRRAGLIKKREFRKSLGTGDFSEARRLLLRELIAIDAQIAAAKRQLHPAPVRALTRSEAEHIALAWFHEREDVRIQRKRSAAPAWSRQDELIDLEIEEATFADPEDTNGQASTLSTAKRLLERHGIEVNLNAPDFRHLIHLVRRAALEQARRELRDARSDFSHHAGDTFFAGAPADVSHPSRAAKRTTLSELIAQHRAEPAWQSMSPKSQMKGAAQARLFEEVFGADRDISQIKRADAAELVNLLVKLPASATKRFPGLTAPEAADAAAKTGAAPITRLTASSYLSAFSTLMAFAIARGVRADNPTTGLSVGVDGVAAKDRRHPFSTEQLVKIFNAPLYTGCQNDEAGYARAGNQVIRRGRFWVPLIALFTGMRMNEICQLLVRDVAQLDGNDVIIVAADDAGVKRVKTAAGERFVPIHPELKRCGLLQYRDAVAGRGEERLFPELTTAEASGYLSDNFSKWFARFLQSCGAAKPRTAFHSFRHNYRDALREADISAERVRALGGWSSGRTEDNYGSGLRANSLAQEIDKVRYEGLDLSHLHLQLADR